MGVLVLGFDFAGFGEVAAGDLEAVEEQAGLFGVDSAAGNALQDLGDGGQDGAAVFERRKLEFRPSPAVSFLVGVAAGGVVVVAERFAAQGWAAAAAAVDEDVAAAVALGCCFGGGDSGLCGGLDDLVRHGGIPPVLEVLKSSKERACLWTSGRPRLILVN